MAHVTDKPRDDLTPILIAGSLVLMLSFGVRASFGVFQTPVAETFNWPRTDFSLAIAFQNLAWGVFQPVFSMIAEKWGDRRALILGVLVYAAGLLLASLAMTPTGQHLSSGLLVGMGVAGTGFGVILAIVGRAAPAEKRSMALGIATAMGSMGQVLVPPLAEWLERAVGWQSTFMIFAVMVLAIFALLPFLSAPGKAPGPALADGEAMGAVLSRAMRDPSYICLFLGFFSCGYQLAFITAHFPAYVTELCGSPQLGALSLTLIGIANIGGTLLAGRLGSRFPKKYLLSAIYTGRTIAAGAFILIPPSPVTVMIFSLVMGALWLATVPLTSGIVAQLYGLKYMGTLYGFVFLSHQIGGFLGVWLGGLFYDWYGSYDLVWWVGVGVGAFSALIHLPVREPPVPARVVMP